MDNTDKILLGCFVSVMLLLGGALYMQYDIEKERNQILKEKTLTIDIMNNGGSFFN